MKLDELAVRHLRGFDISQDDWDSLVGKKQSPYLLKQLHNNAEIRFSVDGNITTYVLVISDRVVSLLKTAPKKIDDEIYQDVVSIVSNPALNKKGYASLLLWELHLATNDKFLIGGAISPKGEKLVQAFLNHYKQSHDCFPDVIDTQTGKIAAFDHALFLSKNNISIVLENGMIQPSWLTIEDKKFWLFSENLFEEIPE
jgi:hypothetical protein